MEAAAEGAVGVAAGLGAVDVAALGAWRRDKQVGVAAVLEIAQQALVLVHATPAHTMLVLFIVRAHMLPTCTHITRHAKALDLHFGLRLGRKAKHGVFVAARTGSKRKHKRLGWQRRVVMRSRGLAVAVAVVDATVCWIVHEMRRSVGRGHG